MILLLLMLSLVGVFLAYGQQRLGESTVEFTLGKNQQEVPKEQIKGQIKGQEKEPEKGQEKEQPKEESEEQQNTEKTAGKEVLLTQEQIYQGDLILVNGDHAYSFEANSKVPLVDIKQAQGFSYHVDGEGMMLSKEILAPSNK